MHSHITAGRSGLAQGRLVRYGRHVMVTAGFLAAVLLLGAPPAAGDWQVLTRDRAFTAARLHVSGDMPRLEHDSGEIPLSEVVFIRHGDAIPVVTAPHAVITRDGNVYRGEWIRFAEGAAHLRSDRLGEIAVPLQAIAAVHRDSRHVPTRATGPLVVLANGDPLDGAIQSVDESGVKIESLFGAMTFGWNDLAAVVFASEIENDTEQGRMFRFFLSTGEELSAVRFTAEADGECLLQGGDGPELQIAARDIVEVLSPGYRRVPLTGLESLRPEPGETLGRRYPVRINESVAGEPLRIGPRWYPLGLGGHSPFTVNVTAPDGSAWLLADCGIDPVMSHAGRFRFSVSVDGASAGETVAAPGMTPFSLKAPVSAGASVELTVQAEDGSDAGGHANWGNPLLIASETAP